MPSRNSIDCSPGSKSSQCRDVATTAATIIGTLKANGTPLDDLHDVYIAATARSRNVPVVTGSVDHFERIENLQVIDWETF